MPPSTPRPSPSGRRRRARPNPEPKPRLGPSARSLRLALVGAVGLLAVGLGLGTWISIQAWNRDRPARILDEARAATQASDWPRAFRAFHAWNATEGRTLATLMAEAGAAQTLNRGRDAELAAEQATRLDPASSDAWTTRLNRLRVLDRPAEAMELGLSALSGLRTPGARRAVLAATTLATLAEVPDAEARGQLDAWIAADPDDVDAQAARMARIAANPRPGDPDRAGRIVELQGIVDRNPKQIAAREALTVALADSGEVDRGRAVLGGWPKGRPIDTYGSIGPLYDRGYQFERLQARWDLEYDHQPARAAEGFRRALAKLPHDWKLHYGLARSCKILGRTDDAKAEALAVSRLRERLEPTALGLRLTTDFARIDRGSDAEAAEAMHDLSRLCGSVGLARLAEAWWTASGLSITHYKKYVN